LTGLCITIAAISSVWVNAHGVAQVQTTKFFAPETVNLLVARASSGTPGFLVGATVSSIIEFTPVRNAPASAGGPATLGVAGYVTDYIPAGTEVIGASMVQPNGSGGYTAIAPDLPGPMDNGWGSSAGQKTLNTNWTGLATIDDSLHQRWLYPGPTLR
jgi:hypothetical protein